MTFFVILLAFFLIPNAFAPSQNTIHLNLTIPILPNLKSSSTMHEHQSKTPLITIFYLPNHILNQPTTIHVALSLFLSRLSISKPLIYYLTHYPQKTFRHNTHYIYEFHTVLTQTIHILCKYIHFTILLLTYNID